MNSIQVIKQKHIIMFFGSLLLSIGLVAGTTFFANQVLTSKNDDLFAQQSQGACFAFLRAQGFDPQLRGEIIKVHHSSSRNIEETLSRASLVMAYCAGHEVVEFCSGSSCEKSGVFFTLRQKKF